MTTHHAAPTTWRAIALSNGIKRETFYARIRRWMTPEEAGQALSLRVEKSF